MTKTPEELTEDWEAGKLPAGWYYLKLENGEIELQNNCIGGFLMSCNNRVIQILSPVPTYDEYKAMQDHILYLEKCISIYEHKEQQHTNDSIEYNKVVEENNNLRALLKECAEYIEGDIEFREDEDAMYCRDILTRIEAAFNETRANPAADIKIQESEE